LLFATMCACVGMHVCVGRRGGQGSLFYNSAKHQRCHEVITVHRPATAGNSHPVSPLLFNLAYFMEESRSTNLLSLGRFCTFWKYLSTRNTALLLKYNHFLLDYSLSFLT
jgi:hypothetical protein